MGRKNGKKKKDEKAAFSRMEKAQRLHEIEVKKRSFIKDLEDKTQSGIYQWVRKSRSNDGITIRERYQCDERLLICAITKNVVGEYHATYTLQTEEYSELYGVEIAPLGHLIRRLAKEECVQERQVEKRASVIRTRVVRHSDLVVVDYAFKCMADKHVVTDIFAIFDVIDSEGRVIQVKKSASYCFQCGKFFLLRMTYDEIERLGRPLCRILLPDNAGKEKNEARLYANVIGPLKDCGYTVDKKNNLGDEERQEILRTAINNGTVTKVQALSYLAYFITVHKGQPNMENAVEKWQKDYRYIEKMSDKVGAIGIPSVNFPLKETN